MKKALSILIAICVAAMFAGACGYKEGVVIPDKKSFLWFTGETKGVTAVIDDKISFELEDVNSRSRNTGDDMRDDNKSKPKEIYYEVEPGKHTIKLVRDEKVILERIILLGNRTTTEIQVP